MTVQLSIQPKPLDGIIQNERFDFEFIITNIGDEPFNGGTLKEIKVVQPNHKLEGTSIIDDPIIPVILSGKSYSVTLDDYYFRFSGSYWVYVNLESDQEVNLYQSSDKTAPMNPWTQIISVNSSHSEEVLKTLKNIEKLLEEKVASN